MRILLAIGMFCGVAALCSAQDVPDRLIVPGERFGPISASTTEEALGALFGADNVESSEVNIGEGFMEPAAIVYPGDPVRRVEVLWRDATRTRPAEVRISGDGSEWKTAEGISLGTTLKQIERLNGTTFRLVGFDFDYGGTIVDCAGGRLKMLGCTNAAGQVKGRQLLLRLRPTHDKALLPEANQVSREAAFSSSHPAMQSLDPRVYQLILLFPAD